MQKEKEMTYEEWIGTYKPLCGDDSPEDILQFDTVEEVFIFLGKTPPPTDEDTFNAVHKLIWTETAGDGWYFISTGIHYVDRMHYFICEVPWKEENEASVYEDQGSYCEYCDENVHTCIHDDDDDSWHTKSNDKEHEDAEDNGTE
jgi:hypothetical protein